MLAVAYSVLLDDPINVQKPVISEIIVHSSVPQLQNYSTVKPRFTDTCLLQTVCFVSGERKPYMFSKFDPLTASMDPSVSALTGFDCIIERPSVDSC